MYIRKKKARTVHLFERNSYIIGNTAVDGTIFFRDEIDQLRFVKLLKKYLVPIAEILHLVLLPNHFRVIIQIRSREELKTFFRKKYNNKPIDDFFIPISSHIISQEMSNLQVSYVKYYNNKYKRKGALMRARFSRRLLRNDLEFRNEIEAFERLNRNRNDISRMIIEMINEKRKVHDVDQFKWLWEGGNEKDFGGIHLRRNFPNLLRGNFRPSDREHVIPLQIQKIINIFHRKQPFRPNFC